MDAALGADDLQTPADGSAPDGSQPGEAGTADAPFGGDGLTDATPTCTDCPLVVLFSTPTTAATTQEIRPHVEIGNNGASAEDMTALTLRYYFTADGSQSQAFACDYTALPSACADVQATFVSMPTPTATADHYLEISFTGESIAAGTTTGDMQFRFHDTSYAVTFTQTNDYSFNGADSSYTQWDHVTLYRSGTLVWGVEP